MEGRKRTKKISPLLLAALSVAGTEEKSRQVVLHGFVSDTTENRREVNELKRERSLALQEMRSRRSGMVAR